MDEFPTVAGVVQTFPRPTVPSISREVSRAVGRLSLPDLRERRIAVAVGSRGISQISAIVVQVVIELKQRGALPYIVPAMGSHGGATPEGQANVLAGYGITAAKVQAEVESSLDTVSLGLTSDGVPVRVDKKAFDGDGIVLVNRVKPHTDFKGEVESGLMKMIAVGLGNVNGASDFHSWVRRVAPDKLIESKAQAAIQTGKILFGMAIVENAYHETALIEAVSASEIPRRERELLVEAKQLMPSLPVDQFDILIVDQIGKDISGAGMDPNVTGRWFRLNSLLQKLPKVRRIIVLDLTQGTKGNALGIGLADFCCSRVVKKMNRAVTYANAITSQNTVTANIPIHFSTDKETIGAAIRSLGSEVSPAAVRLLRIHDTLNLTEMWASETLLQKLEDHPRIERIERIGRSYFDDQGQLLPISSA